jgi:hypothetical protein
MGAAMPQYTAGGAADRVGDYVLEDRQRRDRLGEVYDARGLVGPVRIRLFPVAGTRDRVARTLERLRALRSPAVAEVIDVLADATGRVAVVTSADAVTLAERRRRGRLGTDAAVALGPALLDGLADLHAAGLSHGAVDAALVGIEPTARPRWHDAGLAAALSEQEVDPARQRRADVRSCAAMLRDLTRLPPSLAEIVDPVASGTPGAIDDAALLAAAWRETAAAQGLAVPPRGHLVAIADLLAPDTPRRRRLRLPRWLGRAAAVVLAAGTAALPVAAWAVPGGSAPLHPVGDYLPQHSGGRLTYSVGGTVTATVTLRVAQAGTVAGAFTVSLVNDDTANRVASLGLGGATLRIQDNALVRTAAGGPLRDLVAPLAPGHDWSDTRQSTTGTTTEARTVLGPTTLLVPAGRYDGCVAVSLTSRSQTSGGAGASGKGMLWYCPGVGLARAVLSEADQNLVVELSSVD